MAHGAAHGDQHAHADKDGDDEGGEALLAGGLRRQQPLLLVRQRVGLEPVDDAVDGIDAEIGAFGGFEGFGRARLVAEHFVHLRLDASPGAVGFRQRHGAPGGWGQRHPQRGGSEILEMHVHLGGQFPVALPRGPVALDRKAEAGAVDFAQIPLQEQDRQRFKPRFLDAGLIVLQDRPAGGDRDRRHHQEAEDRQAEGKLEADMDRPCASGGRRTHAGRSPPLPRRTAV